MLCVVVIKSYRNKSGKKTNTKMSKLLAFDDIDEHKKEILWVSYNVMASTKDSVSVCVKVTHVGVRW